LRFFLDTEIARGLASRPRVASGRERLAARAEESGDPDGALGAYRCQLMKEVMASHEEEEGGEEEEVRDAR